MEKKFALIWWCETRHRDVIPLSKIPQKKRQINGTIQLVWENFNTKECIRGMAKLLKIGSK